MIEEGIENPSCTIGAGSAVYMVCTIGLSAKQTPASPMVSASDSVNR
jgi:hypothetical protein